MKRTKKKTVHLTDDEMIEIRQAFDMFDHDASGCIDIHELSIAMKTLGV